MVVFMGVAERGSMNRKRQGAKVGCMWHAGAVLRTQWLMYVPPILDTEPAPQRK